ncbi:uncharacterized protein J3D65DRAFT_607769 [Phyllosticta citribraziliensis]|uniref:Uncharacterized protein n=1 Tax=Phyllosticta citribraziliensis TaxID=989973 RepID=A0ABR1L2R3_9PEZI
MGEGRGTAVAVAVPARAGWVRWITGAQRANCRLPAMVKVVVIAHGEQRRQLHVSDEKTVAEVDGRPIAPQLALQQQPRPVADLKNMKHSHVPSRRNPCMPGCGYCGNSPAKRDVPPADQTWTSSADSTRRCSQGDNKTDGQARQEEKADWQRLWIHRISKSPTTFNPSSHPPHHLPVPSPHRHVSSALQPGPQSTSQYSSPLALHNGLWNRGSSRFTLSVSGHQTAIDTFLLLCLGSAAILGTPTCFCFFPAQNHCTLSLTPPSVPLCAALPCPARC